MPTIPKIITTRDEMRAAVRAVQAAGERVGLVPTMGALHAGHVSLVAASNARCDRTAVTIFVNPTQFLPGEDFEQYPRTLDDDLEALAAHRVDWIFVPSMEEMYGPRDEKGEVEATTRIDVGPLARVLEGRFRPGHFEGVATVVMKLFPTIPADVAFFGQKDYQQTCVIRRMCADLNVPIEVAVEPTVREPDGLAMSSRNRYLSPTEREQALAISRSLQWAADRASAGVRDATELIGGMRRQLQAIEAARIDYVAIADAETLAPLPRLGDRPAVALVAIRLGNTRLIDNRLLGIDRDKN